MMARVQKFARNDLGRDFVIGDVHGAFDLVLDAMKEVGFDPKVDRLFSVGDLIDRGPGSDRCAAFLSQPYVHAVRGNHEDMLLELYSAGVPDPAVLEVASRYNGLEWWLGVPENRRMDILAAISKLPLAIEVDTVRGSVGLIHADVPAGMAWDEFLTRLDADDEETIHACLWGRDRIRRQDTSGVRGVDRLFVGHTPQWTGATRLGNVYAIDSGAVFGQLGLKEGCLTLVGAMARTGVIAAPRRSAGLVDLRVDDTPDDRPFGAYALG